MIRNKKSFSLLEIVIVVMVIGLLVTIGMIYFSRHVHKAQSTEAYVYTGTIKEGQEFHRYQAGEYVALDDVKEINEVLNLGIKPKYYEYRVILPGEDKFLIIAQRIGAEIEERLAAGEKVREPDLIVMSESGLVSGDLAPYVGSSGSGSSAWVSSGGGGGSSRTGSGGGSSSGSSGGTSSGGVSSGGSSGGSGGGTSGGGSSGGTSSGGTSGGGSTGGGTTTGGGSTGGDDGGSSGDDGSSGGGGTSYADWTDIGSPLYPQYIDPELQATLNLLRGTAIGDFYYDFIMDYDISLRLIDYNPNVIGFWVPPLSSYDNTIYINNVFHESWSPEAIACTVIHEATHAEYALNPEVRIAETLTRNPSLTRDDLNIYRYVDGEEIQFTMENPYTGQEVTQVQIGNSVDQEFMAKKIGAELWEEIKGDQTNWARDYELDILNQGEDYFKAFVRELYSDQGLPEY